MQFRKRGGVFKNPFKKKTGARLLDFFSFRFSRKPRSGLQAFIRRHHFMLGFLLLALVAGAMGGLYDGMSKKLAERPGRVMATVGDVWTPKESNRYWYPIAISADGSRQTTANYSNGQIYISTDYGNTWIPKESNRKWGSVDMSADGSRQTAVDFGGQIYVSTDYGNTWSPKAPILNWVSVAMSADGSRQTAVSNFSQIYVSTDYGSTWLPKESIRSWAAVAMTADGSRQTAAVYNGRIYISTDFGNTWSPKESNREWQSIAMSADGARQTAVVNFGGQIYISTDYGNTWSPKESNREWASVAMSADGALQTAVVHDGGQIYISTDYGNTWLPKESNRNWFGVAMSADGSRQTAVVYGGQIYISYESGCQTGVAPNCPSQEGCAGTCDDVSVPSGTTLTFGYDHQPFYSWYDSTCTNGVWDPITTDGSNTYVGPNKINWYDNAPGNPSNKTILCGAGDTQGPPITITSPTSNPTYNTGVSSITLSGISSDNVSVSQITWGNNGGSAQAITVDTISLACNPDSHSAASGYGTTVSGLKTQVQADDEWGCACDSGLISGSSAICSSGVCSGSVSASMKLFNSGTILQGSLTASEDATYSCNVSTTTTWNANINLQSGVNNIVVTSRDAAGNIGQDIIQVTYTLPGCQTSAAPNFGGVCGSDRDALLPNGCTYSHLFNPGGSTASTDEYDCTNGSWILSNQQSGSNNLGPYDEWYANCTGGIIYTLYCHPTNPPMIINSGPSVSNITSSSATISWTSTIAATSSVEYGINSSYGTTLFNNTAQTTHTFNLTGLTPNTTYHYGNFGLNAAFVYTLYLSDRQFITLASGGPGIGGNVSGWGWSAGTGWINFSASNTIAMAPSARRFASAIENSVERAASTVSRIAKFFKLSFNHNLATSKQKVGLTRYVSSFIDSIKLTVKIAWAQATDFGVNIDTAGQFSGYAWSDAVGWIYFGPDASLPAYGQTDASAAPGSPKIWAKWSQVFGNDTVTGWAKILVLGADGWIQMSSSTIPTWTGKGVGILANGDFTGWAWNSGAGGTAGIGWISFNAKVCDTDGDGTVSAIESTNTGCPAGPMPNFKVTTNLGSANQAPTAINLSAPNWASSSAKISTAKRAFLRWDFSDPDAGDTQTAYRVILYNVTDSNIATDTSKVDSTAPQFDASAWIELNKKYKWDLYVWDSNGASSTVVSYNTNSITDTDGNADGLADTFQTFTHEFPKAYFDWLPKKPSAGQNVVFDGRTSIPDTGLNLTYFWNFINIIPASATGATTTATVDKSGTSTIITLTITDDGTPNYSNSTTTNFTGKLKLPSWTEQKP